MASQKKGASSPYATGGGGVTLERAYGATLLGAILLGDPVPGLGDDMRALRVQMQSGSSSPVDDYVIEGANASTRTTRRLSVGVRRDPTIAAGDEKFVKLLGDYVRIAIEHAPEVDGDQWRLALAVAGPHTGAAETKTLSDFARSQPSNEAFREIVAREGATSADIRNRLRYLDEAVEAAVTASGFVSQAGDCKVLTWRLLRALRVLLLRLEGDDATDRTHAIARLGSALEESANAENVFRALSEMPARFAPRAGALDEGMIRRELRGVARLRASAALDGAWSVFATCEEQLRARTSSTLTEAATGNLLTLARNEQLQRLGLEMRAVGEAAGSLIVTGQPDVGKSALAVAAVGLLRSEGACTVLALSLRDLPRTVLEFERLLGASLALVLGGAAVAEARLVVVDGAEAVLEGKAELLAHIARSAARAGLGMVAVAREDAGAAAAKAISVAGGPPAKEVSIPGLMDQEVAQVLERFPALARVGREPRSRWLITRLGLVEILLQSGAHAALPDGALSEADVFAAVWTQHVRRGEMVVAGEATPDGREAALVALARKPFDAHASPVVQDPFALPSLRSDHLLLPAGPTAAWRAGDDFANDIVRDFATARLLITTPSENLLANANAPRWSLRAARLSCQTALIAADPNTETVRTGIQSSFDALARAHGERWADIPWEAVITLGPARDVLQRAIPALLSHQGATLAHLLRVVQQRFLRGGIAPDPIFVEPVVELLCDQRAAVRKLPRELQEAAEEIVAAWLASLAIRGKQDSSHPLRCRVRDELLTGGGSRRRRDEHRIRCLGLLGPDLNADVDATLRQIAHDEPSDLHPCLEQSFAPISLSVHRLDLLLVLTEAYYVELPERDDGPPFYRHRLHDEGIRRHHGVGGFGSPLASPIYGPFWCLLRASFPRAIAVINRTLNHAARYRVVRVGHVEVGDPTSLPLEQLPGIEVELPGVGSRRFAGDEHTWRWYRGNAVGPYPCISALVAIERVLDQILVAGDARGAGTLLARIVTILLEDCENLAIPGLIVGMLVRYAHLAPLELLAPWVESFDVWHLEFERAAHELQRFHVHGADPDDQPGRDRRRWSFRELGYFLVARALVADDRARLASLNAIGDAINAHAAKYVEEARNADPSKFDERAAAEFVEVARGWASSFQHVHFRIEQDADGRMAVQYVPPKDEVEDLAVERRDHERGQQAWRLGHVYTVDDPAAWNATLPADIAIARELEANPPNAGPPDATGAPTAVAAGAIESLATGFDGLQSADITWAIDTVVRAASRLGGDELGQEQAVFPWGADRAAARSLPRALTLPDDFVDEARRRRVADAVRSLASSPSEEVRRILATALRSFWCAPCRCIGDACIHALVLDGFRQAARLARLSGFDPAGRRRSIVPLAAEVESALAGVPAHDLLVDRLVAPLVAAGACASSTCCAQAPARVFRDALLGALRDSVVYYAEQNYQGNDENDRLVAEVLLDAGEAPLLSHVRAATEHARALDGLLRDLAVVATINAPQRQAFRAVWPSVMDAVLDAVADGRDIREERYGGARAFAGIVPRPIPTGQETDLAGTVQAAGKGWPTVAELQQRIDRWLPLAEGSPEAVDSLVGFLETAPLAEQIARLSWVTRIVSADFAEVANRSYYLPSWLERLRASGELDAGALGEYQRMVDGLVAAGDSRALRLQIALEQ
jgi:hypothetical protein